MAENEYYARVDYIYEGGDTRFSVPFPYIDKKHIVAIINGDTENPITELEFLTDNQIQINAKIITGATVSIRRITPLDDRFVDFTDGNILDEESLDLSALQVFNVVQEIKDSQDALLESMSEFINLRNLIEDSLNTIESAVAYAQEAQNALIQTQELVNDISNTYNALQKAVEKGLECKITHNMFEIIQTDKILTAVEKTGLEEQGSVFTGENFPDAYETIIEEFNTGTKQVYTSDEIQEYYKSYTGSETGEFYIPSSAELTQGQTLYSDEHCLEEIGSITEIKQIKAQEILGSVTPKFYISENTNLEISTPVYSDKLLVNIIGTVEDIKNNQVNRYSCDINEKFYIDTAQDLRVGRIIYQDTLLQKKLGTITSLSAITSNKYHISGLEEIEEFYVPDKTVLQIGTEIFSDSACTNSLGKITAKGTGSTGGVYTYTIRGAFTASGSIWMMPSANLYTKEPLRVGITNYTNSSCTTPDGTITAFTGSRVTVSNTKGGTNNNYIGTAVGDIISQSHSGTISYNYLKLNNQNNELTYYKMADVTCEVLSIDNGKNQSYKLEETTQNKAIKLSQTEEFQTYIINGLLNSYALKIDEGVLEEVTDNGLKTTEGVVFEYIKANNEHLIIDIKYKNALDSYLQILDNCPFYILDKENQQITLPILDKTKFIYFCLGNTVLLKSGIKGVTEEELNLKLENYVKLDNETLKLLTSILTEYTSTLGNINTQLTYLLGE